MAIAIKTYILLRFVSFKFKLFLLFHFYMLPQLVNLSSIHQNANARGTSNLFNSILRFEHEFHSMKQSHICWRAAQAVSHFYWIKVK